MKKIIAERELDCFSYENCMRQGHVDNKMCQYSTTVNESFISLRSFQCEESLKKNQNPLGWKFHISIDDEESNMILAWNVIAPLLIKHKINFSKFMRPKGYSDESREIYDRGRQFTIYIEQNNEKTTHDWQDLINTITHELIKNNIKPGYINMVAKVVPGSSYFYYRNDKPIALQAGHADAAAPSSTMPKESEHAHDNISDQDPPLPPIENRTKTDRSAKNQL
jgi:hypothetical protein